MNLEVINSRNLLRFNDIILDIPPNELHLYRCYVGRDIHLYITFINGEYKCYKRTNNGIQLSISSKEYIIIHKYLLTFFETNM